MARDYTWKDYWKLISTVLKGHGQTFMSYLKTFSWGSLPSVPISKDISPHPFVSNYAPDFGSDFEISS